MTTRDQVVAALSEIDDVNGYEYRPIAPKPGDAWPLGQGYVRDDRSGQFFAEWRVLIVMPTDDRTASTWMDAHVDAVVEELGPVGYITAIRPVELQVANSPAGMLALEVTMRSE